MSLIFSTFLFLYCGCCSVFSLFFFFFKQKTAYELRISDWSSDVCSSDLQIADHQQMQEQYGIANQFRRLAEPHEEGPRRRQNGKADRKADEIGRASCRERVCQ